MNLTFWVIDQKRPKIRAKMNIYLFQKNLHPCFQFWFDPTNLINWSLIHFYFKGVKIVHFSVQFVDGLEYINVLYVNKISMFFDLTVFSNSSLMISIWKGRLKGDHRRFYTNVFDCSSVHYILTVFSFLLGKNVSAR